MAREICPQCGTQVCLSCNDDVCPVCQYDLLAALSDGESAVLLNCETGAPVELVEARRAR